MYTLLHTGLSLQDDPEFAARLNFRSKELAPVVEWLCRLNPDETYTASLMANALALLPRKTGEKGGEAVDAALRRAHRYLISAMGPQGGYTYGRVELPSPAGGFAPIGDLSNAQYGALGMWALEEAGISAPPGYWMVTDVFWRRLQQPSGSWAYRATTQTIGNDRDSMGVAGLATLYMAQEFLDKALRSTARPDKGIDLSQAWLNVNFKQDSGDLYYMYGVERIGIASGLKFFGTTDWYRTCAAEIMAHQQEEGSWDQRSWFPGFHGTNATTATSFALLFLARGRNPVVFNKLQYDGGGAGLWNARPRDAAYLTRWLSKRLERPLNWQVVNLAVDPEEWLDAPILLITGSRDPKFTMTDVVKLRQFIEAGGMIFSTADDGRAEFTEAMKKYAGQISAGRWEMRTLLKTHVLYNSDLNAELAGAPPLMGMSNGIREVWIHSPTDLGAAWQMQRFSAKPAFEVPTALYFYATGKIPLKGKLKTLAIAEPEKAPTLKVNLARVTYSGNWIPSRGPGHDSHESFGRRDRPE